MRTKTRSIEQIIEEQVRKWQFSKTEPKAETVFRPIVTISREPGSGGNVIGERLARRLDLDLFHQEMIHAMAKSAKVSSRLLETLDERGLSALDDWMAYMVDARHMWPDQYMKHLMKVIGAIGRHGGAVLIGRGANFILPPERRFSVRVIAPFDVRAANVARDHQVSEKDARNRITKTDSQRRAFIRKFLQHQHRRSPKLRHRRQHRQCLHRWRGGGDCRIPGDANGRESPQSGTNAFSSGGGNKIAIVTGQTGVMYDPKRHLFQERPYRRAQSRPQRLKRRRLRRIISSWQ